MEVKANSSLSGIGLAQSEKMLAQLASVDLSFQDQVGRAIRVLHNIDLTITEHEIVGLLGPSGCGKTSLLQIIAGILSPSSGLCEWDPQLIANRGIDMAIVFQKPTLLPWCTVDENVFLPYRLAGRNIDKEIRDRADQLFHTVRLQGFRTARPHELSGGMQMRVALVRAFLTHPRLILMDEPFSALDEETRLDLCVEMLRLVSTAESSVVFVTHSIQEVAFVSNRVLQMSARPGRILRQIDVEFDHPRDHNLLDSDEYVSVVEKLRARFPRA